MQPSRIPALGLLALIVLSPLSARAQTVPPECTAALRRSTSESYPVPSVLKSAEDLGLDTILPRLRAVMRHTALRIPDSLAAVWKADSADVEAGLATIIVNELWYGSEIAQEAAEIYRSFSGRSGPILTALMQGYDVERRELALSAITALQDEHDGETVLSLACDAAWQLTAFTADPSYAKEWRWKRGAYWAAEAKWTIKDAVRLLTGKKRVVAEGLLRRLSANVPDE